MKSGKPFSRALWHATWLSVSVVAASSHAATIWTGPKLTYVQPGTDPTQAANQDRLTDDVWLTRGPSQGLFNASTEVGFTAFSSPEGTRWANGFATNHASLTFTDWHTWAKGANPGPPFTVGVDAVLHLVADDIYLDIKFTAWGQIVYSSGFTYERSTPAAPPPTPSVSITNPANNAVFAAPANLTILASATVSVGSVTNVAFFSNSISLGSVQTPPFTLTTGSLGEGGYVLTAVATAGGISATSAPVNITVILPTPITIPEGSVTASNGQIAFNYAADPGLSYVVERASALTNWLPVLTNVATANLEHFAESILPGGAFLYRVGRLPNP